MKWLLAFLLSVMSGAALAETTGAVNPSSTPAQPSANEDVPPGGCMPIGMTTSGEIVFPIQCKEFIERHRGAAVEQKPALEQKPAAAEAKPTAVEEKPTAVEEKPAAVEQRPAAVEEKPAAVEEKPATKQSESAAPEESKPANKPVQTIPLQKRVEHVPHQRAMRSDGCKSYRTYDPVSATYRGYDGHRRSCR
jgi:cell division protein FtsN